MANKFKFRDLLITGSDSGKEHIYLGPILDICCAELVQLFVHAFLSGSRPKQYRCSCQYAELRLE